MPPLAAPREDRGVRLAGLLGVRGAGRVLRDFVAYLPTQVIPAVAGFLALPLLARRLAPTELGVLAIAQTLVSAGWIVSAQWLTSAVLRELPAHREGRTVPGFRRTLGRGLGLTALGFGAFVATVALAGLVSDAVAQNTFLIVAATLGLIAQNIAGTLFAASLRPRGFAAVELVARTGGIVLGVKLVFDGHGIQGYLFGLAAASLAAGAVGLVVGWPRGGPDEGGGPAGTSVRSWFSYGTPLAVSALSIWALLFVDRYLLAALKTTGDVGIYTVGSVIGDKAVTIPTLAFYMAARPLLITAFERTGRAEAERLMREYTRVVLLIGLPILAYVAVVADRLVALLTTGFYGTYYEPAADVVPLIALGTFLYVLGLVGNTGLILGKRPSLLLYSAGAALVANVVANLLLIPPFGIVGAAVATVVGTAAFLATTQLWAGRYATWRFPWSTLVRGTVAATVGGVAALSLMRIGESDLTDGLLAAVGGAAVYLLALALLGERPRSPATTPA